VLLAVVVDLRVLAAVDRSALAVIQTPHAAVLDLLASIVVLFGHTEVVGTIALATAIVWWRHRRAGGWLLIGLALVIAVELILKQTLPQPAPPGELARGVELLPFLRPPTAYTFPSGHVARVAFLVTAVGLPLPVRAATIAVMALASVYLGGHWPTDVVGGWLLGYTTAAFAGRR
jgi:undecaprenyl-diphosphatase